jgi:hypothetical protein
VKVGDTQVIPARATLIAEITILEARDSFL